MKTTTTTFRNLIGGFTGGFLGVIIAGFIHPIATPLGCIAGVLVGYWHDEVVRGARFAYRASICMHVDETLNTYVSRMKEITKKYFGLWAERCVSTLSNAPMIIRAIAKIIKYTVGLPLLLLRYFLSHPVATAHWIIGLIYLSVYLCLVLCSYWIHPAEVEGGALIRFVAIGFLCGFTALMRYTVLIDQGPRSFYLLWSEYAHHGTLAFTLKETFRALFGCLFMALYVCVMIALMVVGLFGFMILMCSTLAVTFAVQTLWKLVSRSEHLICLVSTLVVTITSVVMFKNELQGFALWVVSLGTGCAAGLASEIARRAMLLAFDKTPIWRLLVGSNEGIDGSFDNVELACKAAWRRLEPVGMFSMRGFEKAARVAFF